MFSLTASVQQKDQAGNERVPTFQSGVNLVLVSVVVRNKQGQAIGGLTQEDFQIFDRGKRQDLVSFSSTKRPGDSARSEPALKGQRSDPQTAAVVTGTEQSHPETAAFASVNASPQRFVVYLFDDLDSSFTDIAAVRSALSRHLRGLLSTDRAAIYTFTGRSEVDFTGSREQLEDTAAKLRSSLSNPTVDDAKGCPDINYYLADLIRNRDDQNANKAAVSHTMACAHVDLPTAKGMVWAASQRQLLFGPQQSRMALRTLRLAIKRLAGKPGERLIILTSPGFYAQTPEAVSDTEEVLKMAVKAHITISTLSSRGLYTAEPDASDSKETSRLWREYQLQSIQSDEGIMEDLARGTGGVFFHNNDDLRAAFDRLATPPEFSYLLGFQPANSKPDGTFHPIKIRLANEKGLTIEARRGYYALKENSDNEPARLEVDDAVFSRDQMNQIPVVLQTGYTEPNNGDPTIMVSVKVNLKPLSLPTSKEQRPDSLTVVSALFNGDGSYLTGTTKTVRPQLRSDRLAQTDSSVTLHFAFHVKRGTYLIRLVVRDAQSGAMTTLTRPEKIS